MPSVSTVSFQAEKLSEALWAELMPLLLDHWSEIATHQDIPLDPMYEHYDGLQRVGKLRVFTVRDEQWNLIGYAGYTVAESLHYRSCLQANQDVLFIAVHARKGTCGARLVHFADHTLRGEGVQLVTQHVKIAHPILGVLLERQGYTCVEKIYTKRLDLP